MGSPILIRLAPAQATLSPSVTDGTSLQYRLAVLLPSPNGTSGLSCSSSFSQSAVKTSCCPPLQTPPPADRNKTSQLFDGPQRDPTIFCSLLGPAIKVFFSFSGFASLTTRKTYPYLGILTLSSVVPVPWRLPHMQHALKASTLVQWLFTNAYGGYL